MCLVFPEIAVSDSRVSDSHTRMQAAPARRSTPMGGHNASNDLRLAEATSQVTFKLKNMFIN
jgi:hypothetical protein